MKENKPRALQKEVSFCRAFPHMSLNALFAGTTAENTIETQYLHLRERRST
ncbi:MAG: hypothetical protein P4L42_14915 [Desulfocapsaceae bacterium]|nr:hypothetical protein [Desulfocapsaceae bacterium]